MERPITIQDIDVDDAAGVTTDVVIETAKLLGVRQLNTTETSIFGYTIPLGLEL